MRLNNVLNAIVVSMIMAFWPQAVLSDAYQLNTHLPVLYSQEAHTSFQSTVSSINYTPSPDGNLLATQDTNGEIKIWETGSGRLICNLDIFDNLSLILNNIAELNYKEVWKNRGGTGRIYLAWSRDGKNIMTPFYGQNYVLWNLEKCGSKIIINEKGAQIKSIPRIDNEFDHPVYYMATLRDGRVLIQTGKQLVIFNPFSLTGNNSVEILETYDPGDNPVYFPDYVAIANSEDGKTVVFRYATDFSHSSQIYVKNFKTKSSLILNSVNKNDFVMDFNERIKIIPQLNRASYVNSLLVRARNPCFALSKNGELIAIKSQSSKSLDIYSTKSGVKLTSADIEYVPSKIGDGAGVLEKQSVNTVIENIMESFRANVTAIVFSDDQSAIFVFRAFKGSGDTVHFVIEQRSTIKLAEAKTVDALVYDVFLFLRASQMNEGYRHYIILDKDVFLPTGNAYTNSARPSLSIMGASISFVKFGGEYDSTIRDIVFGEDSLYVYSSIQNDLSQYDASDASGNQGTFEYSINLFNFNESSNWNIYSMNGYLFSNGGSSASEFKHMNNGKAIIFIYANDAKNDPDPNAKLQAINYQNGALLWEISRPSFETNKTFIPAIAIANDGSLAAIILYGPDELEILLFDMRDGREIGSAKTKSGGFGHKLHFSSDNKYLWLQTSESLFSYEITKNGIIEKTDADEVKIYSQSINIYQMFGFIEFIPAANKFIVAGCKDLHGGRKCASFKQLHSPYLYELPAGFDDDINHVFDLSNGLIAIASDTEIILLDLKNTPIIIDRFAAPSWRVKSIAVTQDGKKIAIGDDTGCITVRDLKTKKTLLRLFVFGRAGWAVIDSNGRFDASNLENLKFLHWILPDEPFKAYPVDMYVKEYYYPGLFGKVMQGSTLPPIKPITDLNRALPVIKISKIDYHADAQNFGYVDVTIRISSTKNKNNQNGGVSEIRLLRSGQLVGIKSYAFGEFSKISDNDGAGTFVFKNIALPKGKSKVQFSAYAFNDSNIKSEAYDVYYETPATYYLKEYRGKAYIITVGIDVIQSDEVKRLNFAASDANKVQKAISSSLQTTGQYAEIIGVNLISTNDSINATKSQIKAVFELLSGNSTNYLKLSKVPNANKLTKATPDDLIIFSYSGHGARWGDEFYLLPRDFSEPAELSVSPFDSAISSTNMADWISGIDAKYFAMIIDACNAAAIVQNINFSPAPARNKSFGQLAYDKGIFVLAAAQPGEAALEAEKLKQGILTYALINEGLELKKADSLPFDHVIDLAEWLNYAAYRVPVIMSELKSFGYVTNAKSGKWTLSNKAGEYASKGNMSLFFQQPVFYRFQKNDIKQAVMSFYR